MKSKYSDRVKLFATGFTQVILVAINTYQIANRHFVGAFIVGFLISFVWSFNVKKIAFGTMSDRIFYSLGAAFGSASGLYVALVIYG
jgi:hypothetical protein